MAILQLRQRKAQVIAINSKASTEPWLRGASSLLCLFLPGTPEAFIQTLMFELGLERWVGFGEILGSFLYWAFEGNRWNQANGVW